MKITNWMGRMSASVSSVAVVSFLLVSNVADAQAVVVPAANLDAEGGGGSSVLNDNIRLEPPCHQIIILRTQKISIRWYPRQEKCLRGVE